MIFKKKWVMVVICIVLALGAVLLAAILTQSLSSSGGSSGGFLEDVLPPGGDLNNGVEDDEGKDETDIPSVEYSPEEVAQILDEGFYMYDTMRITANAAGRGLLALRAGCYITPAVYDYVASDPNKSFGTLIVPYSYVENAPFEGDKLAWHEYLDANELVRLETESTVYTHYDEKGLARGYYTQFSMTDMKVASYNRKFTAISFIKTVDGDSVSYEYARYKNGYDHTTFPRSLVNLAAEKLDQEYFKKLSLTELEKATYRTVVKKTIHLMSGTDEEYNDNGIYLATPFSVSYDAWTVGSELPLLKEAYAGLDVPVRFVEVEEGLVLDGNTVVSATHSFSADQRFESFMCYVLLAGTEYMYQVMIENPNYGVSDPSEDPVEKVIWLDGDFSFDLVEKDLIGVEEPYIENYHATHDACGTQFYFYGLEGYFHCPSCGDVIEIYDDFNIRSIDATKGSAVEGTDFSYEDGWGYYPLTLEVGKLYFIEDMLFVAVLQPDHECGVPPVGTVFFVNGEAYTVESVDQDYIFFSPDPPEDFDYHIYEAVIAE